MDLKNRRLFSVCDEKVMAVVNADTGAVVATPTICDGPDAAGFDPATGYVFASCGDGNLTVIHQDSPDKYSVVENVPTKRSARTMGLDLKTHNIFLPSAEFDRSSCRRTPWQNEARLFRHRGGQQVINIKPCARHPHDHAHDWAQNKSVPVKSLTGTLLFFSIFSAR